MKVLEKFELTYKPFGERSILVEWPQEINEKILKDVQGFRNKLENSNDESIVEVNSTYNSLLVIYNVTINRFYDKFGALKSIYSKNFIDNIKSKVLWKIPVCYDLDFGTDLVRFSEDKNMSIDEIILYHSDAIYTMYFIGFLPGFLYLGDLNEKLHLNRKSSPELYIKKGSVAIGGKQTGIYPQASPGGWHIIGNSPLEFFDAKNEKPCFVSEGDKVQFVPIDIKTYENIKSLVDAGVYVIESEELDD